MLITSSRRASTSGTMARFSALYFALVLFALFLVNVSAAEAKSYSNIVAYLKKEPKFSVIYSYIKKSGLEKTLSNGKLEITLFLPNNKAFTPAVKKYYDYDWKSTVETNTLNHAVHGIWTIACLKTGVTLETLDDGYDEIPTNIIADTLAVPGQTIVRALWSSARVVGGNVRAGKALVHEIDNLLMFYGPTAQPEVGPYSTIEAAITGLKLTKFANMVASYKPTGSRLTIVDLLENSEVEGTVFAWTDAVYDKTVKECGNSNFFTDLIVAYSFTYDLLPLPRLASNYQYKTFYMSGEEVSLAPPAEGRITYVPGRKLPSILIERRRRLVNITRAVYTGKAVLYLLDGIPFPSDRDGLCGY